MKKSKSSNVISTFLKAHKSFFIVIALMSVFRSAVADWYTVPSSSMMPTIEVGDRITVNKMAYDLRLPFTHMSLISIGEPKRNDIIVFNSKAADMRLIKRVVALPGDHVSMRNEILTINGVTASYQPLDQSVNSESSAEKVIERIHNNVRNIQVDKSRSSSLANFSTVTVPKDHYLVLGDNRRNSSDSRVYGFVPRQELLGRANYVAFSLDYENKFIPRSQRLIKSLYL
ncbi:signal peptidase I [Thalassotalea profundi]|uniref:Signal peptidase I n=1 Tax=Thalassotalea profundi TaxID=2036687 RepID=A0ABQ3ID72_9GAMM|nr:signal peptidase I [Thalassotalea profundi]GHE79062.1 signal peptidase I [Thalassotalea profundi]